ncbi:prolyl oligopeptidase PreP (S9A serine peptidase family) [Bradyrhizobium sp. LB7.1]
MSVDDRPTLSAPDDDPWLWLEEIEGKLALDFVARQNSLTLDAFGGKAFGRDRDILAAIYDRPDNIPYVSRRGDDLHNLWKDATNPRGLWRKTSLAEFRKPHPAWEIMLDVDQLAAREGEDWLLSGITTQPGNSRAILSLSRGGSDAVTLREFDIDTKSFVEDGFALPEAKGGADWLDADTLLLSSAHGEGMATSSGYSRTVRLWRRGQPVDQAQMMIETTADHMAMSGMADDTAAVPRSWFVDQIDFFNHAIWLRDADGTTTKLDLPTGIWMQAHGDWFAMKLREAWSIEGRTYAADTVLGMSLSAFLAGSRDFAVLFEPEPRRALQGLFWAGGRLVLSILDELQPQFEICTPSATSWSRESLGGLPQIGVVDIWPLDRHPSESNGDLLANVQDPLTPPSLLLMERGAASPIVLKQAPKIFTADGLVVTQHEAISIDGRAHSLCPDRPRWRERRCAGLYERLWRLRPFGEAVLQRIARQAVAGARRHDGAGEFARRRRIRHTLARCRPARRQETVARRFRRGRRRSRPPWRDQGEAHRRAGRIERRHPHHQHAGAIPRTFRRAVLHDPADRHAPLHKAARRRELDRGIWRS